MQALRPDEHPGEDPCGDPIELGERRLLAQVSRRHLPAFDALYRSYHGRLTRFLDRVLRRRELVEEVLDDTMLVVWDRAHTFNGNSKVSTWIFAIAYRKALKALRRLDDPVDDEGFDEPANPREEPEQVLGQAQLRAILAQALAQLSPEHRAVVALTYFHDAAYGEIAQIVDCPVDTVKTRMFYARRRLKTLLAGSLEDWL